MIEVNGIQLQIESEPRLLFMANDPGHKGRATKTFSIIIANNPVNNEALDNLFSKRYFRQVRFPATMTIMDIMMLGSLLITDLDKMSAKGVFTTSNALLWELMEDKNIRSYDWSEFNVLLNDTNVMGSENNADIVFELTDRGEFDFDSGTAAKVDITERYPAVKIGEILKTIFKQHGVFLSWHGEAGILEKLQNKYYLQYTQSKDFRNSNEWMDAAFFYAEGLSTVHFNSGQSIGSTNWTIPLLFDATGENNPGGYWNNVYHYFKAAETGTYRFVINLEGFVKLKDTYSQPPDSATTMNFTLKMKRNDTNFHTISTVVDHDLHYIYSMQAAPQTPIIYDSKFIHLNKNDTVSFELHVYVYYEYTGMGGIIFSGQTDFECVFNTIIATNQMSRYYGAGSVVRLSEILPDMNTLKFLGSLFKTLGINVYYNHLTNEAELHAMNLKGAIAEIDVYDVKETIEETQNIRLKFNTDKVQQPGDEVLKFDGARDDNEVKFDFSRTLFYSCYRLFNETNSKVSVLWDSDNPLHHPRFINYKIAPHSASGNLRVIEYKRRKTGVRYYQTYGYVLLNNEAKKTTMPEFAEPDYVHLQRWQYSAEPVTIVAKAKLNQRQVWGFYMQEYFKYQVILKTDKGEAMQGWVEEVEQLDGNIYQITMMRI